MNIKLTKIINRNLDDETDDSFTEFLKKYWWIEFLALSKVTVFISKGYYGYLFGFLFLLGAIIILWILYKIGLE